MVSARAVRARVVQIKYQRSYQATWALRFTSGGQPYFLTKNPFVGRRMFGPSDAIMVLGETHRVVSIPYKVAMAVVLDEQARATVANEVEPFIKKRGDWFKNP